MDWLLMAAFMTSVYYTILIWKEAAKYDWREVARKAVITSNLYRRYVYWGCMQCVPGSNPTDYYVLGLSAGSFSMYMVYCLTLLLDHNYGWFIICVSHIAKWIFGTLFGLLLGGTMTVAYYRLSLSAQKTENLKKQENLHQVAEGNPDIGDEPGQ